MNNSINTPEQPCNKISYNQFQFDFYTEISREKMYEIVLENEAKITRVSPELFKDLIQFNNRRQSRNHT